MLTFRAAASYCTPGSGFPVPSTQEAPTNFHAPPGAFSWNDTLEPAVTGRGPTAPPPFIVNCAVGVVQGELACELVAVNVKLSARRGVAFDDLLHGHGAILFNDPVDANLRELRLERDMLGDVLAGRYSRTGNSFGRSIDAIDNGSSGRDL